MLSWYALEGAQVQPARELVEHGLIALGIVLLIGLIQAATSIQEMTLSFVPKLFVVLAAMALFAPYTLNALTDYFAFIFEEIATKGF